MRGVERVSDCIALFLSSLKRPPRNPHSSASVPWRASSFRAAPVFPKRRLPEGSPRSAFPKRYPKVLPRHRSYHIIQKSVSADIYLQIPAAERLSFLHPNGIYRPHRRLYRGTRRAKRLEIVLALQTVSPQPIADAAKSSGAASTRTAKRSFQGHLPSPKRRANSSTSSSWRGGCSRNPALPPRRPAKDADIRAAESGLTQSGSLPGGTVSPSASKWHICPAACTPASVRPLAVTRHGAPERPTRIPSSKALPARTARFSASASPRTPCRHRQVFKT